MFNQRTIIGKLHILNMMGHSHFRRIQERFVAVDHK